MTTDPPDTSIEDRLRRVEDQLAIYQVIGAYGPAMDSCEYEQSVDLWLDDGVYEVGGLGVYVGHGGLRQMIDGPFHQGMVKRGSAHVLSLPYVVINGDRAVATNYGRLYACADGVFEPVRVVASRWLLRQTEKGWLIERRVNMLLNGDAAARELLARAGEGPST